MLNAGRLRRRHVWTNASRPRRVQRLRRHELSASEAVPAAL